MTHIPYVRRSQPVSTFVFGVALCLAGVLAGPASAQLIPLAEFQSNTSAICAINPKVIARPDGGFAVLWGDQMVGSFRGRFYSVDGIPETGELAIQSGTSVIFEDAVQMPDGGFLGIWTSFPGTESTEGGSSEEVLGRRFAADGTPLGGQFAISSPTTGVFHPRSAVDESGEFVVVWEEEDILGSWSVEGRRFASDGTPVGGQFTVTSSNPARLPEVAKQADSGEFAVVWHTAGVNSDIAARNYDSSGLPTGGEFIVNTFTSGFHSGPEIALSTAGEMLVTWSGPTATSGGDTHTMLALLDSSGVTEEEVVISNTSLFQWSPALAASPDLGSFVVGWEDIEEIPGSGGVLTADPRGAFNLAFDQQLTGTETAEQTNLAAAIDPAERATVVWLSDPDDDGCAAVAGLRVQLYKNLAEDETAVRVHSATQQLGWKFFQFIPGFPGNYEIGISQLTGDADLYVRTGTLPDQSSYDCRPFVGGLQEESCVVNFAGTPIWVGINGFDAGTTSLMLTTGPETPLFADGFESGNTLAWSLTVN